MKTIIFIFISLTIITSTPLTCSEALTTTDCTNIINGMQYNPIYHSHECTWYENQCQFKTCQNSQIPCDGLVYQGELCSNSQQGCQSVKECSDIDNQESCSTLRPQGVECHWDQSCVVKTCSHNTKSNCKLTNSEKCIYQNDKCSSINQCSDIIEKSRCLVSQIQGLNCIWSNDQCLTNTCKAILNKEECFKSVRNSEKCFYTQNRNDDNHCLSCSQLTEECKCNEYSIFGCEWQNDSCLETSCNQYTNQISCTHESECVWYKPMNKCVSNQEAYEYDRACDIYIYGSILHICALLILIVLW